MTVTVNALCRVRAIGHGHGDGICHDAGREGIESIGGRRASDTSALCWVCAGLLGGRGLELVVHFSSGIAKINIQRHA